MTKTLSAKTCTSCDGKFVPKSAKHKYCSKECRNGKKPDTEDAPLRFTLTDESNHLLSTGPSAMSCGLTKLQDETVLLMTVRTSSATVTVALNGKEAAAWLTEFAYKVKEMQDSAEAAAD